MARYQFTQNGGTYGPPKGLASTLLKVRTTAKRDGRAFRIKPQDGEWSRKYKYRPPFLLAVRRALKASRNGDLTKFSTRNEQPVVLGKVYLIRKVRVEREQGRTLCYYSGQPVDLSDGNPRIAAALQWAADTYPRVMCSGYKYTRKVEGTSVWSQHSAWAPQPGFANAGDLTVYLHDQPSAGTDMDETRKVALGLVEQAKQGKLHLRQVIFGSQVWEASNRWNPVTYNGTFHSHAHVEGEPQQTNGPVDA